MKTIKKQFLEFAKAVETIQNTKENSNLFFEQQKHLFTNFNESNYKAFLDQTLGNNPNALHSFNKAFRTQAGIKDPKFNLVRKLTDDEKSQLKKIAFTTTVVQEGPGLNTIGDTIETNIITALDRFVFDSSPILSKVRTIDGKNRMDEWAETLDAEIIGEADEYNPADDLSRPGDTLQPKMIIDRAQLVTGLTRSAKSPEWFGALIARQTRAVQKKVINQIINGNNTNLQFSGLLNTNTGANAFGAIETTFATSGSTSPSNDYFALVRMIADLPGDISEEEASKYVFIVNRATYFRLSLITDANNSLGAYIEMRGGTLYLKQWNIPVHFVSDSILANNKVILADLSNYYLAMTKEGVHTIIKPQPTNDTFMYVTQGYFDGGMVNGFKFKTDGTTSNKERNAFRFATLKDDYSI